MHTDAVHSQAPRTRILGVVNITPDSFSDGGDYLAPERAAARARELAAGGADAIDLGPATSHPARPVVSADEEIRRLGPVLDLLAGEAFPISVDSRLPDTQRYALARGVAMLNDISGVADASVHAAIAAASCDVVVMHARPPGVPPLGREQVVGEVERYLAGRAAVLERAGIARSRLVLDPGMGLFLGDDAALSIEVLRAIPRLRDRLGLPILVGVSRKSFLGAITGRGVHERGPATLAAELFAAAQRVDWIRTHDVAALRDALAVRAALGGSPGGATSGGSVSEEIVRGLDAGARPA
jgi:dihydropteroate synthase type 2